MTDGVFGLTCVIVIIKSDGTTFGHVSILINISISASLSPTLK
jgi:hypothetical protein